MVRVHTDGLVLRGHCADLLVHVVEVRAQRRPSLRHSHWVFPLSDIVDPVVVERGLSCTQRGDLGQHPIERLDVRRDRLGSAGGVVDSPAKVTVVLPRQVVLADRQSDEVRGGNRRAGTTVRDTHRAIRGVEPVISWSSLGAVRKLCWVASSSATGTPVVRVIARASCFGNEVQPPQSCARA